jgi:hypothetical protein
MDGETYIKRSTRVYGEELSGRLSDDVIVMRFSSNLHVKGND